MKSLRQSDSNKDISCNSPQEATINMYMEYFGDRKRSESALHHPLLTGSIILPTRPIRELFKAIKLMVILRDSGCCFSAYSGVGKSRALAMVETMLHKEMPSLPIYQHSVHNQQIPSIRAFFKHFLVTVGHRERRGETFDLRQRVVDCMVNDARLSGMNVVLLLIDEAHVMSIHDFNFLKDIYNELNKRGVALITVMMGQEPEMPHVVKNLKRRGRLDLISRFGMKVVPFSAFDCEEDIVEIMKTVDESQYPPESGITWTSFFLHKAFLRGFRLQNEAVNFMAALLEVAPEGVKGSFTFPARQTFLAIRRFLLNAARHDSDDFHLPKNAWRQAVFEASLEDAMRLILPTSDESDMQVEI